MALIVVFGVDVFWKEEAYKNCYCSNLSHVLLICNMLLTLLFYES